MLGCAIAEGILRKTNFWLGGKNVVDRLLSCDNRLIGGSLVRGKLAELNCRRNYGTIIRPANGAGRCVKRVASYCCRGGNLNVAKTETPRFLQTKPYEIETNLPKDVILYKYENPKYFKRLNIFGISQLLFWTYLAQFVYSELRDVPVNETETDDLPWWSRVNLGDKTNRKILTLLVFFVGYSLFALSWMHTLKSVRYLVLRKGGNDVTFVSYTPFGGNRLRTVPLAKVTSKQSREAATVQLPLKVKGDFMHYLLDMRGEFKHPRLFDFTAGLKRSI